MLIAFFSLETARAEGIFLFLEKQELSPPLFIKISNDKESGLARACEYRNLGQHVQLQYSTHARPSNCGNRVFEDEIPSRLIDKYKARDFASSSLYQRIPAGNCVYRLVVNVSYYSTHAFKGFN
jgi:hypothetical protein